MKRVAGEIGTQAVEAAKQGAEAVRHGAEVAGGMATDLVKPLLPNS